MRKVIFATVLIVTLFGGCDENFLQQADRFVEDVNTVKTGTEAVLRSPAGAALPPDIKLYGTLGILLASGLVNGWQEWRNKTMKKTTKAIVKGIEQSKDVDKSISDVKHNIADEMQKQGGDKFYAKANKIVDKLKIS